MFSLIFGPSEQIIILSQSFYWTWWPLSFHRFSSLNPPSFVLFCAHYNYYCSSVFYHSLLLKSYQQSVSSATRPILLNTYRTVSTAAALVLCNLLPLHFSIIGRSLQWLIQHGYLVREWASFRPLFKAHHSPPKFLTSDRLQPTSALSLKDFCTLLDEQIYVRWQREWEALEVGSTTRLFLPNISDHSSYPLDLNFFVT